MVKVSLRRAISQNINTALKQLNYPQVKFSIEYPGDESHGDLASNVSLVLAKELKKSPMEIAQGIKAALSEVEYIESIDVAEPGFMNIKVTTQYLLESLRYANEIGEGIGRGNAYADKKIIVEYTDPNPFKIFHIGHVMSNTIGESVARLFEFQGAELKRANYQGDVGMHVAMAVWGVKELLKKESLSLSDLEKKSLHERISFLGRAYTLGVDEVEKDSDGKPRLETINKIISNHFDADVSPGVNGENKDDESLMEIYTEGRQWSLDYFEEMYARLGTHFDYYFFESKSGTVGENIVRENIGSGIFEESEGAIVFRGEKYGMHTRVFINSQGIATYEAKELGLAQLKQKEFPYDLSVIVTGNEVSEYFKVLIKALELVSPELSKRTVHIGHGMMRLPSGKMSSRSGDAVPAEEIIDRTKEIVKEKMKSSEAGLSEEEIEEASEIIAIGAVKYSILKQRIGSDIIYHEEKAVELIGDTGPYLQYTHTRGMSVLAKSKGKKIRIEKGTALNADERRVILVLTKFADLAREASELYIPHIIAKYLHDLSGEFNTFYNNNRILDADNDEKIGLRLAITKSATDVLRNGLWILGIEAPEKM